MTRGDLVSHLAGFAGALRERGVPVSLLDEIDGATALTLVDVADRREVYTTLVTSLKIDITHRPLFDALFARWWDAAADAGSPRDGRSRRAAAGAPVRSSSVFRRAAPEPGPGATGVDGREPGYSPDALLRRKPFEQYGADDIPAMQRLLARVAVQLATRRSRRLVPTRGAGLLDLRRSFRRALGTSGEILRYAKRARAVEQPRLVVLCDTSGSMDPHTRFLLTFVFSLRNVARNTEVFTFNTALTRVTPWIAPTRIAATLDRLALGVPDWSGGTKIGTSLADFVATYQNQLVDSRTVVIILSDGLDRGDPETLLRPMRAIQRRARRLIWLNPLIGDPRYEPTARGMAAALPFVDHFLPAHNLESLERLLPLLAA